MAVYDFATMLEVSKGFRQATDATSIQAMIPGCTAIRPGDEMEDRRGIDFVATLRKGATINIDAKIRRPGCSRFWRGTPDFALEDWSVMPENGNGGKVGWTLDESKLTDYIWFAYDPGDSRECYLVPFQLLRIAAIRHWGKWQRDYKNDTQSSNGWHSHCVFVPVPVVLEAITEAMRSSQPLAL